MLYFLVVAKFLSLRVRTSNNSLVITEITEMNHNLTFSYSAQSFPRLCVMPPY